MNLYLAQLIFFLESAYFAILWPTVLLAFWAKGCPWSTGAKAAREPASSGVAGAEAARAVLSGGGVTGVQVDPVIGEMADFYDPWQRVLRLSERVYSGRSLASIGVAAHEAAHALQGGTGRPGLIARQWIVPTAGIGSSVVWLLFAAAALLQVFRLLAAGIVLLALSVAVQLVNLPVELDASRRARGALRSAGLVAPHEEATVGRVLSAAAWAHVAATLTGAPEALYGLVTGSSGRRSGRRSPSP
jgi:Zn-dependent membrane protease YugP